jgi:hypothetical protein
MIEGKRREKWGIKEKMISFARVDGYKYTRLINDLLSKPDALPLLIIYSHPNLI